MSGRDGGVAHSTIAREARAAMARAIAQWTPEERLIAFLEHCRLMTSLHVSARQRRRALRMRTRGPGQSALLLVDVVSVLEAGGIDYAVIGAMAAAVDGVVRTSIHADVLALLTIRRASELEQRFRSAGCVASFRLGDQDDPIPGLLALEDAFGNRVDLLIGLRGFKPAALARAVDVPFQGITLRVIGPRILLQ
jgi:hypothetical protein